MPFLSKSNLAKLKMNKYKSLKFKTKMTYSGQNDVKNK